MVRFGTFMHPAVRFGAVPVVRFFLRFGSSPRRDNGTTPLFLYGAPHEFGFWRFSRVTNALTKPLQAA